MSEFTLTMPTLFSERMEIIKGRHPIPSGIEGLIGMATAEAIIYAWIFWEPTDFYKLKLQIDEAYKGVNREEETPDDKRRIE
jgi:hypothetical protein